MMRLDEVGFKHTLRPVAYWKRNGWDLALVREYVPGAVEGRLLALTSLRDLLGRNLDDGRPRLDEVGVAGGDLSSEVRRLGEATGNLHLALAEAFGVRSLPGSDTSASASIRVHGDYHLRPRLPHRWGLDRRGFWRRPLDRQVRRPRASRAAIRLALEDLADLSYSLRQVAAEAVAAPARRDTGAGRTARQGLGASRPGRLPEWLPRRRGHSETRGTGPPGRGGRGQDPGSRPRAGDLTLRSLGGGGSGDPSGGGCHGSVGGVQFDA